MRKKAILPILAALAFLSVFTSEVFWEFYFTTHRKWSFLKTPIFRKIYDSFRVLPQKKQYPIPGGAIPA